MSERERWVFIINPVAGNGYAAKQKEKVEEMIRSHHLDAPIVLTEYKGHATELVAQYADKGYTHIAAIGGDGTFWEATQALVGRKGITFGAISAGTGNDFINILGFSEHFTDADWEIFFQGHTRKMDVGCCNGKYFINGMGLGFDAQVASENYNSNKDKAVKKGSKLKYWWHIIKTLLLYRESMMRISTNGTMHSQKSFLNTIAIGRRFAGGFYLTPKAIADDGMLDICMIEELKIFKRVRALLRVLKKKHTEDPEVKYFTTNKIVLEFDEEVPSHLDGELYFSKHFEVSVIPQALNIIYNPSGNHFFERSKEESKQN